jgi:hypothetical protein
VPIADVQVIMFYGKSEHGHTIMNIRSKLRNTRKVIEEEGEETKEY